MKSNTVVSTVIKNYNFSQNAFLSKEVDISLSQEYGTTYTSVVKAGDIVKKGTLLPVQALLLKIQHIFMPLYLVRF